MDYIERKTEYYRKLRKACGEIMDLENEAEHEPYLKADIYLTNLFAAARGLYFFTSGYIGGVELEEARGRMTPST